MTYLRYRPIMKPYQPLLLSFALLLWVSVSAQKTLERVSERVCRRMEKANLQRPADSLRTEMMNIFMEEAMLDVDGFMKDYKLKTFDESAGQMIGQELGKHLVSTCPAFLQFSLALAKDEVATEEQAASNEHEELYAYDHADETELRHLYFLDEKGKEVKFYWTEHFPGSDLFTVNPERHKGKHFSVKWKDAEYFLPKADGYYQIRILSSIELREN